MPTLEGSDIVCVGFADWQTEIWTNQHHLMARLAASNRVLFIESLGLRRPTLTGRDLSRILRRLRSGLAGIRQRDGVHVLSPLVIPMHAWPAVRAANKLLLRRLVLRATKRLGFTEPILWSFVPQAETLVDALGPSLVVYHVVDDIAAHGMIDSSSFAEIEARFVARAGLVLASSQTLVDRLRVTGVEAVYLPNVADTALFVTALDDGPIDSALETLPRPRAVFVGAIAGAKVDLPLVAELAGLLPEWSFALVGPIGLGDPRTDISILEPLANVHLLGPRAHHELPAVLRGADAGLIPYAGNRLTASIFPMKVYEYLAAGLPVLATNLPALEEVDDVTVVEDAASAASALVAFLADDSPEQRVKRSRRAMAHNWDSRVAELRDLVANAR